MDRQEINNLILENEKLAYMMLNKYAPKFNKFLEYDELKSICLFGLTKAANTYDVTKEVKFSTYACTVINNEILFNVNKCRKSYNDLSLNDTVIDDIKVEDIVKGSENIEEQFELEEEVNYLNLFIDELPGDMQLVIKYSLQGITQTDIAKMLDVSQPQISRLYYLALDRLRNKFNALKGGYSGKF